LLIAATNYLLPPSTNTCARNWFQEYSVANWPIVRPHNSNVAGKKWSGRTNLISYRKDSKVVELLKIVFSPFLFYNYEGKV
jgi:hypothetical protein